jgi:hypothetical protein
MAAGLYEDVLDEVSHELLVGLRLVHVHQVGRAVRHRVPVWVRLGRLLLEIVPMLNDLPVLETENVEADFGTGVVVSVGEHEVAVLKDPHGVRGILIRGSLSGENSVQLKIAVHFVDDWRILTALRFNALFGGYDVCIHATDVADMVGRIERVIARRQAQARQRGKQCRVGMKQLDIAGHGTPGGWMGRPGSSEDRLTLECLQAAQHPTTVVLKRLRTLWSPAKHGMVLRMCETALGERGRKFLVELSRTVGANVRGWDGRYEFRATGQEITAYPNGTVERKDSGLVAFSAIYDRRDFWNNPGWRWYMYNPGFHLLHWTGRFLGAR